MTETKVRCSKADVAAYADTRACRELGFVPTHWVEREVREERLGVEHVERSVVLVLGKAVR